MNEAYEKRIRERKMSNIHSAVQEYCFLYENILNSIRNGTDINKKILGETALHVATRLGNRDAVRILLNCDADINARNEDNLTPLDLAIITRNPRVETLLKQAGAR